MDSSQLEKLQPEPLGRNIYTKKLRKGTRFIRTSNGYCSSKSRKRKGIGGRPRKIGESYPIPTQSSIPIDCDFSDDVVDLEIAEHSPMTIEDTPVTPSSSQQLENLNSLSFSTPRNHCSFPFNLTPESANCKAQGRINFSTLNSAVRQKEKHISCFEDEYGKEIYSHVRLPDRHLPLSQCSSEKTIKRRSDDLLRLSELLVKEASGEKNDESIAKIIVCLLNRNKNIKRLVEKQLNLSSVSVIPTEKSLPMLVHLAHSKNTAEQIMSGINKHVGRRIFEARLKFRKLYDEHDLNAKYEAKTLRIEKGDFIETIPVAFMTNIHEVLISYVKLMSAKIEVSSRSKGIYRLRIAVDKGGSDTKISISFADSVF